MVAGDVVVDDDVDGDTAFDTNGVAVRTLAAAAAVDDEIIADD